jgi:glycosyltransferase involved in cell wall biosynthesis
MRIAIIADPLDNQRAGVHVYTRNLVDTLIRNKGSHEIILLREKIDPELKDCEQYEVPNTRLPIGFASLRLFFLIPFLLRRKKVDVVIEPAHFGPFNLPSSIYRVTMIHDLTPLLFPQHHRWHSQWLQRIFLKRILRRTDLVLSNSHNTSKDIVHTFPFTKGKVQTIHLGKDTYFTRADSDSALTDLGISDPFFHYVGTIEPRKGLLTLLQAYKLFRDDQPDIPIKLVIAGGKGWKSEAFYEACEKHPYKQDVILTGFVKKSMLPILHTFSKALIYPSTYEGFGLPILEALSCGANVITARNSSLTEVGGEEVTYFETNNADDLYQKMVDIDRAEITSTDIQRRIEWSKSFDWNEYGQTLISLLENRTI